MNETENLLDIDLQPSQYKYATLIRRAGATIIDGLILACFSLPVTFFDMFNWKSPAIYMIMSLITLLYKPFMEYQYGATIGKKVLKIKVVNYEHEKVDFFNVWMRNLINILIAVVSALISLSLFYLPGFESVKDFMGYANFVNQNMSINWINWVSMLYYLIDIVFLLTDERNRTLHDRLGKTYVIMVEE